MQKAQRQDFLTYEITLNVQEHIALQRMCTHHQLDEDAMLKEIIDEVFSMMIKTLLKNEIPEIPGVF